MALNVILRNSSMDIIVHSQEHPTCSSAPQAGTQWKVHGQDNKISEAIRMDETKNYWIHLNCVYWVACAQQEEIDKEQAHTYTILELQAKGHPLYL